MNELEKLNQLTESHGALRTGKGGLATHPLVHKLIGWAANDGVRGRVQNLNCFVAVRSGRAWPDRYGVVGDCVPNGFFRQLAFPFRWKG